MSHPRWLARYLDGERDFVWHELRQLGDQVREPAFASEAQAVCDEMARRARHNVEVIVERLLEQGYHFHVNDDTGNTAQPLSGPVKDAEAFVGWLEQVFGPVPMVLSSWVRIVGDVWMVGTHPKWPTSAAGDPLVVEVAGLRYPADDLRSYLLDEFEQWGEYPEGKPFRLPIAPDHLHKNNISGGPTVRACPSGRLRRRGHLHRYGNVFRLLPPTRLQHRRLSEVDRRPPAAVGNAHARIWPPAAMKLRRRACDRCSYSRPRPWETSSLVNARGLESPSAACTLSTSRGHSAAVDIMIAK